MTASYPKSAMPQELHSNLPHEDQRHTAHFRRHGRLMAGSILAAMFSLLPALSGCGSNSSDPIASTDTGNPPVVDQRKIEVTQADDGVTVRGEAGAVDPGGIQVEVTNLSSGDRETVNAAQDGSFEVELPGELSDDYRVEAADDGRSDSTTVSGDNQPPAADDEPADDDPGSDDPAAGFELTDREFLLTSSEGFTPAPDTNVSLDFRPGAEFRFSAGCNSHFGYYTICGDRLCVDGFGSTEIGCQPPLPMQDEWLANFFTSRPQIAQEGDELTFANDEATLVFLDREVAIPDAELTSGTWFIDTFIQGNAASNLPLQQEPTIEFSSDGTVTGVGPCNTGSGTYVVDGTRLIFSAIPVTERGCPDQAQLTAETLMFEVLTEGTTTFEIDETRLTIMREDSDVGLSARLE